MTQCTEVAIEEWRPVVGVEKWYEVSSLGKVRRIKPYNNTWNGRHVKLSPNIHGRMRLTLSIDRVHHHKMVHALVAEAFLGRRPNGMTINHIDGDKTNNAARNLEHLSIQDNQRHAKTMGLYASGERNPSSKLTADEIRTMRSLGETYSLAVLASIYGVSKQNVSLILKRKAWRSVD